MLHKAFVASPEDRKELFKRYHLKMKELKGSKKPLQSPKYLKVRIFFSSSISSEVFAYRFTLVEWSIMKNLGRV